ncbi:MAG: hypothetical protein LBK56_15005 [Gracilibacteraceae bacterium]|jgi:hypothetical protein|nr:hypothetical protein [Gracilibacteraceae bacterium]
MSESEYHAAIAAQAQQDAANGVFHTGAQYNDLLKSFVSVVSPDRKNLFNGTVKKVTTGSFMGVMHSAYFYDGTGNMAAWYNGGGGNGPGTGWCFPPNKAEIERWGLFNSIYIIMRLGGVQPKLLRPRKNPCQPIPAMS